MQELASTEMKCPRLLCYGMVIEYSGARTIFSESIAREIVPQFQATPIPLHQVRIFIFFLMSFLNTTQYLRNSTIVYPFNMDEIFGLKVSFIVSTPTTIFFFEIPPLYHMKNIFDISACTWRNFKKKLWWVYI